MSDAESIQIDVENGDISEKGAIECLMEAFGWNYQTAREQVEEWGKSCTK